MAHRQVSLCTKLEVSCPSVPLPCLQEIKARCKLSERNPALAHSGRANRWQERELRRWTDGRTDTLAGAEQGSERRCQLCVSSLPPPLAAFTYLSASMAAMTGPLSPQKASQALRRPFKRRRKNFKSRRPCFDDF